MESVRLKLQAELKSISWFKNPCNPQTLQRGKRALWPVLDFG